MGEHKRYSLDTEETIRSRFAATHGTLPRYVYEDEKGKRENILESIKKYKKANVTELLEEVTEKIPELDPITDVLYVWLLYSPLFKDLQTAQFSAMQIDQDLQESSIGDLSVATKFLDSDAKRTFRKNLEEAIEQNKKKAEKQEKLFKEYDSIKAGLKSTLFELEKVNFNIIFKEEGNQSPELLDLFNRLV